MRLVAYMYDYSAFEYNAETQTHRRVRIHLLSVIGVFVPVST